MTTGYVIEVTIGEEVRYVGAGAKLGTLPRFFNSAPRVKSILSRSNPGYGNSKFQPNHIDSTRVIKCEGLERGLKGCKATMQTVAEFLQADHRKGAMKIPNNPRAIYRIQLKNGEYLKPKSWQRNEKFGRTWYGGGNVRNHITGNLRKLSAEYKDAIVLEIEMREDGFTPKQVKTYPIIDFYCASKHSREQYNDQFSMPYNPPKGLE